MSGDRNVGLLWDAIAVFDENPCEPLETIEFAEPVSMDCSSTDGRTIVVSSGLTLLEVSEFMDPCCPFTFQIASTQPAVCWEVVSRNLRISAKLEGSALPAVSLRAAFSVLPTENCVIITIAPAWWAAATSFTIDGLFLWGQIVGSPLLPANIAVINVNHTSTSKGRLWDAAKAGDTAGVIAAIQDGCSTEETDDKVVSCFITCSLLRASVISTLFFRA